MRSLDIPESLLQCRYLKCKTHIDEVNEYCENLILAIEKAAVKTLPSTKPIKSGCPNSKIMGWNENVRPFKEEAQYWRSLWISAGRPNNHPLFTNMKSSKAQYKYAIRRVKKSAELAQNNAFLSQILDKKSSGNLYSEIKKFRKERKNFKQQD